VNAICASRVSSYYMRRKELSSIVDIPEGTIFYLDESGLNLLRIFEVGRVIKEKLDRSEMAIIETYENKCIPLYAQGMKETYGNMVITSF